MTDSPKNLARAVLAMEQGTVSHVTLKPVIAGMSEAAVFRAVQRGRTPRYVKVACGSATAALREEIARMRWLAGNGIAVPRLLRVEDRGDSVALLMEEIAGVSADASALPTPRLVKTLAAGLAALHALSLDGCPFDETLATRLSRAENAVAAGDIDPAEFAPRNRNIAPADLLRRLNTERPREDIVVLHGDATLSNIIVDENGALGFIDCRNAGRGDRHTDLALLHDDITRNRGAAAGAQFLKTYGATHWDHAKADYYLDLYELF